MIADVCFTISGVCIARMLWGATHEASAFCVLSLVMFALGAFLQRAGH